MKVCSHFSDHVLFIGWGLIIQIGVGIGLTGIGLYGMFNSQPNDPKKPSQKFLEKVKKVLTERGWYFWIFTGVGVTGVATLSLASWNYKNGREPDLAFLYQFIPKKFDPSDHGIGNPKLKKLEDHFLYTMDYTNLPHIHQNNGLKLTQYVSFDPYTMDPAQIQFYYDNYVDQIGYLSHNTDLNRWLNVKPTNADHLTRCVDFLKAHPELNKPYEQRLITFLQNALRFRA